VLTGAYITAPVRCAPPANKPTPAERDRCRPFLERELALLAEARVFLALGASATSRRPAMLGVRPRPRFGHGVEVALPTGGRFVVQRTT
jgi:uracil-DNA glycosylase